MHHSVKTVAKIISADSELALQKVRSIYEKIIDAEIIDVTSIKTAEACKTMEKLILDFPQNKIIPQTKKQIVQYNCLENNE